MYGMNCLTVSSFVSSNNLNQSLKECRPMVGHDSGLRDPRAPGSKKSSGEIECFAKLCVPQHTRGQEETLCVPPRRQTTKALIPR